VAVIRVSEFTVKAVAASVPNITEVAPVNPEPVTIVTAPPATGPAEGERPVTAGTGAVKVNWSAGDVGLVPPAVVTVTSTVPATWAGDVAVICESEITVNEGTAAVPNVTADAPVKPVPVMVTEVPPAVNPPAGEIKVTPGIGTKVNWSEVVTGLVPPAVATVTSMVPAT
jgi:hypothetical protein